MSRGKLPLFFAQPNQLRHLANLRSRLVRFRYSLDLTGKEPLILKANPIDEVLKHWITSCINMFGEGEIKLPCQAAVNESVKQIVRTYVCTTKVLSSAAR